MDTLSGRGHELTNSTALVHKVKIQVDIHSEMTVGKESDESGGFLTPKWPRAAQMVRV